MSVQPYDVEFSVLVKSTKELRSVTRREYSYNVQDAFQQALINLLAEAGPGGHNLIEVNLMRIGPAKEYVEAASTSLRAQIDELMARIKGRQEA